jgi:hypothetical protein
LLATACAAAAVAGPAFAETLTVRNFVGRVEVITGDYDRLEVELIPGEAGDLPRVSRRGADVDVEGRRDTVDWSWDGGGAGCRGNRDGRLVRTERGGDYHSFSELPLIRATAPRGVTLEIDASLIEGVAGAVGAADIELTGCASLAIESTAGPLGADLAGAGILTVGTVAAGLDADIAGAGVLSAGDVRGPLVADVAGAGRLHIEEIRGDADIDVAGAAQVRIVRLDGDVMADVVGVSALEVEDGQIGRLDLDVAGMSHVNIRGSAREAKVDVAGISEVDIAEAADADVSASGMSDVRVNGRRVR